MKFGLSLALVATCLTPLAICAGPTKYFIRIEGSRSGDIYKGNVRSLPGSNPASGLNFSITSPRDSASGQATGRISPKPLQVLKPIDDGTPVLVGAMVTNEVLKKVTILAQQPDAAGTLKDVLKYTLTNAQIASLNHNGKEADFQEELGFVYQKLEVEAQGKVSSFDWV